MGLGEDFAAAKRLISELRNRRFEIQTEGGNLWVIPSAKLSDSDRERIKRLKMLMIEAIDFEDMDAFVCRMSRIGAWQPFVAIATSGA